MLFGYLAAVTSLELVTGIIILPQRQTALVAKQAAEVDLLTRGRFRLGVGIGWNPVEYEALGKDFTDRGRRIDEQIELMRRLWTEPSVTHDGTHERVTGAGIAPLPVQRPIPMWIGAMSPPAYRRIGRYADGWFPQVAPGPQLDEARAIVERGRARRRAAIPWRSGWRAACSFGAGGAGEARGAGGALARRRARRTSRSTRWAPGSAAVDGHLGRARVDRRRRSGWASARRRQSAAAASPSSRRTSASCAAT